MPVYAFIIVTLEINGDLICIKKRRNECEYKHVSLDAVFIVSYETGCKHMPLTWEVQVNYSCF